MKKVYRCVDENAVDGRAVRALGRVAAVEVVVVRGWRAADEDWISIFWGRAERAGGWLRRPDSNRCRRRCPRRCLGRLRLFREKKDK